MNRQGHSLPYMPELDGLRAIAVIGVLITHYVHFDLAGLLGLRLFFVLSGFLITRVLLEARKRIESSHTTVAAQLRVFYAKRFLRLFPALLLFVVIYATFDVGEMRTIWPWHLTYLSNIYFATRGEWGPPFSLLWTLSVEEQFYLVWPLIALLAPRRHLSTVCVVAILVAVVWRIGAQVLTVNEVTAYVLPFSKLDTLGSGALLAIATSLPAESRILVGRLRSVGRNAGVPACFIFALLWARGLAEAPVYIFFDVAIGLAFAWLVSIAASGIGGFPGRFLSARPIVYIGRISYGLYLFHEMAPPGVRMAASRMGIFIPPTADPLDPTSPLLFIAYSATAIAIASLSWFAWEQPISRLRRRLTST